MSLLHLLDPEETRAAPGHKTRRLVRDYEGANILAAIRDRYFKTGNRVQHSDHDVVANDKLDADFSEANIRAVLFRHNTQSAPGQDRVTDKVLRNLDDESISRLVN